MRLTVCTYNLRDGGLDGHDLSRLWRQLDMLRSLDVDVIGLQEAKHWDRDGFELLHLAEQTLGMRGFLVQSNHHGCHLAILVCEPRVQVVRQRHETGSPYWHAVACLEVDAEGFGQPLQLVNAHLAPFSPTVRLAEAEALALVAKRGPTVALGDWNAVAANEFPQVEEAAPQQRRKLDHRPAEALEDAGLLDVGAYLGHTTPTVGHDGGPAYRCDRVHTNLPASSIAGYKVLADDGGGSDHRPVLAVFTP